MGPPTKTVDMVSRILAEIWTDNSYAQGIDSTYSSHDTENEARRIIDGLYGNGYIIIPGMIEEEQKHV